MTGIRGRDGRWKRTRGRGESVRRTGRVGWGEQWVPEAVTGIEGWLQLPQFQMRTGKQTLTVEENNSVVVGQMAALAPPGPV